MTYDASGNMLTSTDARGKTTTYSYDVLNRIVSIAYASGPGSTFEYDGGTSGAPTDIGQLTKMTDESGETTFSYGGMGRLVAKVQTTNVNGAAVTLTTRYAYGTEGGALGKVTSVTYPSGNRINYLYGENGRVTSVSVNRSDQAGGTNTGSPTVLLSEIEYTPFGAVQSWKWGNHSLEQPNVYERTYDLDGRITSYPLGNPAATGTIRTLTYDAGGRITNMAHSGPASSLDQTLTYDGRGRITGFISATASHAYVYDVNSNRTKLTSGVTTYSNTISTTSNRMATIGGPLSPRTNLFDTAGNVVSDGSISYSYSDRGRLSRVVNGGVGTDYLYNARGERVSKAGENVPGGVKQFAYSELGEVLGEYSGAGTVEQETVYLDGVPIAVLSPSSIDPLYVYSDHLGTPRIVTRTTGSVVWDWSASDPFGATAPLENSDGGTSFVYNLRFPGQLFDAEKPSYYNYFRDYDPSTGRYVQSDPIGLAGGINTYGYVDGNPISYVDPTGEISAIGAAMAVAGIAWAGYKFYKDIVVPMQEAVEAGERAAAAREAYYACIKRRAGGENCSCEKEKAAHEAAYREKLGKGGVLTGNAGKTLYSNEYFKRVTGGK